MSTADVLVNAAYIIYILAPLVKQELGLRLVLTAASVGYILWGIVDYNPWVIFWNALFILMSLWRLGKLFQERRPIELTETQSRVRQALFPAMKDRQFLLFWMMGEDCDPRDRVLTTEGAANEFLYVLHDGEATVRSAGQNRATLRSVTTIGEMSFVAGEDTAASATVELETGRARRWRHDELHQLEQTHPDLVAPFLSGIGRGLSAKVGN